MSFSFWFDLLLAVLLFAGAIVFIHHYRYGAIRDFRARRLRSKIIPKLQALLTAITDHRSSISGSEQANIDQFLLFRARADVEALISQSAVLFSEERVVLADFMVSLSAYLTKKESGVASTTDLENTILAGQRATVELTEIGF